MNRIPRSKFAWLIVTLAITMVIVLTTIFSLKSGYQDIFPYFYILPVLLLAYTFPRYSVYFTIAIGWVYLGLVYTYGTFDIRLFAASSAWFYIFVTIGVLLSSKIEELNQERQYRGIFDNSQAGIFTFGREKGLITEINGVAAQFLGYEAQELHNAPVSLIWSDPAEREHLFSVLDEQNQISDTEMSFSRKDHSTLWGLVTASAGPDGNVICSVVDITERKKLKDIIDESELRYRTLFDFASDAILIHDVDGRIFEANRGACDLSGLSRDTILSSTLHDLDPDAYARLQAILVRNLHTPGTSVFEISYTARDGRVVPLEVSSRPIQYRGGSAIISIMRDITERRIAEDALRESEKRYRTLVDQLPDYILVHRAGIIQYVNPAAARMLGYDPSEIRGTGIDRFIQSSSLPVVADAMKRRNAGEPVRSYEITIFANSGSERTVMVNGVKILYDGAPATLNVLTDITERKQAEGALKESEERYRAIFNNANDAIHLHEIEHDGKPGPFIDVNDIACRMLLYSRDELLGLTPLDIAVADHIPLLHDVARTLMAGGVATFETGHRRSDGIIVPVEISAHLIRYQGRSVVVSVIRDITERKRSIEALRESEERYRMIGELIPFGVWMADASGTFTYLSRSFLDLLGLTMEECAGGGWQQRLHPQDREQNIADWNQCVRSGCFWDYEYRITDQSGNDHSVLSRGAPIHTSTGAVTSWVGIHFDITDMRLAVNRLETSLREKEVVIKEVHHRVKNNMQVISGFLLLQSQHLTDPESIDKLTECQQRVKTMALVHERLYQGRSLEFIDAADYVKSLVTDLLNSSTLNVPVDTEIDVDHININLDMAIPMGLVINELVTNSLKYAFTGRSHGKISVSLHLGDDHRFHLTVRDDGVGLPPDYSARSATTLGTQLVKVLVGQLGGDLSSESVNGAAFTIDFPEKF